MMHLNIYKHNNVADKKNSVCCARCQVPGCDALLMIIGCTKESLYSPCPLPRWRQDDYSTGAGINSRRLCLPLCFLIVLELRGDLQTENEVVLVGRRGQLIPSGNLELRPLELWLLEGVLSNQFYFWQGASARGKYRWDMFIFSSSSKCVSGILLYSLDAHDWVVATSGQKSVAVV